MKKRMMGLLLSTVMISSLLTGCGGGASDNSAGRKPDSLGTDNEYSKLSVIFL